MIKENSPGRPSVSLKDTKQEILEAGLKIFSDQGFSGTSISQIAREAQVNQSLIYHHFTNKLGLWRAVKTFVVQKSQPKYLNNFTCPTLQELISEYISSRFDFCYQNPDIIRIFLWQQLDSDHHFLRTSTDSSDMPFYHALEVFKKQGQIFLNIDLTLLINMINNLAIAPLIDHPELFKNSDQIQNYKETVVLLIMQGIGA